jgi:hypothetical protein
MAIAENRSRASRPSVAVVARTTIAASRVRAFRASLAVVENATAPNPVRTFADLWPQTTTSARQGPTHVWEQAAVARMRVLPQRPVSRPVLPLTAPTHSPSLCRPAKLIRQAIVAKTFWLG